MFTLRMLGGIELLDDEGRNVDALLRQPKHIALLAYLALPRPGTWHRRDSVLGAFWAEHDQVRARSALRSALYILRGHFPPGAVISRGDVDLSVGPEFFRTDVADMSDDLAAGRFAESLARYRGDLLPGVFVPQAGAFEMWLEQERTRARSIAAKAAAQLADSLASTGNLEGATDAARRAAELCPDDEAVTRRWIALLDQAGDRAQAFAVYERFRNHMSNAFGVRPSAETVALLDGVRTRHEANGHTTPAARKPNEAARSSAVDADVSAVSAVTPANPTVRLSRVRWLWIGAPLAVAAFGWLALRPEADASAAGTSRSLVVLPMINETGDSALAYIATGIPEGVARRLDGIGGLTIRSGARSDGSLAARSNPQSIRRELGAALLLRGTIHRAGDSLEVRASLLDAQNPNGRDIKRERFSIASISDVESRLAASIGGEMFSVALPSAPRALDRPVDPVSYDLTLQGWHQFFVRGAAPGSPLVARRIAAELFTRATNIDPMNARAWSGLSAVWASQVVIDAVPYADGKAKAIKAALHALSLSDSLEGSALVNLAIMRAFEAKDVTPALDLLQRAEKAEPWNPEVFLVKSLIYRSSHQYDKARDAARMASQLDPLSPFFANEMGSVEFCAGSPTEALKAHQLELSMNPADHLARAGVARANAMRGRYDDAIADWRIGRLAAGDTAMAKLLPQAKGRQGYWELKHAQGRKRLAALQKAKGRPLALMHAYFGAGDSASGYRQLDAAREAITPALYRLTCMPDIDEFRNTPEFAAALNRIGSLHPR